MTRPPGDTEAGKDPSVDMWWHACASDDELRHLSSGATVVFGVRGAEEERAFGTFAFLDGTLASSAAETPATDFEIVAPSEAWERFSGRGPDSPYHSFFAMLMRVPGVTVTGDQLAFAQHAHLVRRVLEIGRELRYGGPEQPENAGRNADAPFRGEEEPITGRYRRLTVAQERIRVYYEEAGRGRDLLFLHTAGSDARQFYHLMNDQRLLERCHMVAFDLPWHGRSLPPKGSRAGSYALTTAYYADVVEALADALGLDQPVVLGSSMGGEICLELAYRSPGRFGAAIACEASDHVTGRQVGWAKDPRVNQALFVPEWVYGLMAPQSPEEFRREVWWEYSQSGFGTYYGDILFYSGEWDARDRVGDIDTARCPVFLLTGEYDYSCTPEMSRRTAEKIPGASFRTMPGIGHFPMAENPPAFVEHLLPVLDEIDQRTGWGPAAQPGAAQ